MIMNPTSTAFNTVIAFEVAKATLVVHTLPDDQSYTLANKSKEIRKFLTREMRRISKDKAARVLVVCEATGGYERHVVDACMELGLALHKAHGSRVRQFAKYRGVAAKTDPIDARVLALYGLKTEGLRLYVPPSPEVAELRDLKTRRDQIQHMLQTEINRLEGVRYAGVRRSLQAHILALRKDLKAFEAQIAAHVKASEHLARKAHLMRSLKGIGPTTVASLLAYLPELGTFNKAEVAAIAGLAPINRDSGTFRGQRHIAAGRRKIRAPLYMAALVAIRFNPVMRRFADALKRRGKPAKVVITAVMRKLIVILNAILRSGEPWRQLKTA